MPCSSALHRKPRRRQELGPLIKRSSTRTAAHHPPQHGRAGARAHASGEIVHGAGPHALAQSGRRSSPPRAATATYESPTNARIQSCSSATTRVSPEKTSSCGTSHPPMMLALPPTPQAAPPSLPTALRLRHRISPIYLYGRPAGRPSLWEEAGEEDAEQVQANHGTGY